MKIKLREYQKQDFKAGTTSRKRTHKIDKF